MTTRLSALQPLFETPRAQGERRPAAPFTNNRYSAMTALIWNGDGTELGAENGGRESFYFIKIFFFL